MRTGLRDPCTTPCSCMYSRAEAISRTLINRQCRPEASEGNRLPSRNGAIRGLLPCMPIRRHSCSKGRRLETSHCLHTSQMPAICLGARGRHAQPFASSSAASMVIDPSVQTSCSKDEADTQDPVDLWQALKRVSFESNFLQL